MTHEMSLSSGGLCLGGQGRWILEDAQLRVGSALYDFQA